MKAVGCHNRSARRGGSALIIVLWAVAFMALLVAALGFDAQIEARITRYYRNRTKAHYLALSGLDIAKMLMVKRGDIGDQQEAEVEDDRWFDTAKRLRDGLSITGMETKLGEGAVRLDIVPEPARRNINRLGNNDRQKEENLERILEVGGVPQELWAGLIESFLDWCDRDDTPRTDGGETEDYYASLEPAYRAKNGELDTVEELLLVKGFNRTILYGGVLESELDDAEEAADARAESERSAGRDSDKEEKEAEQQVSIPGIYDLLTVYGNDTINPNAASMRVLMTLPGVDDVMAGAIIEEREGEVKQDGKVENDPFRSATDLFARFPDLGQAARQYVSTDAGVFRITSVGKVGGVEKMISCVVEYSNKNFTILRWREED